MQARRESHAELIEGIVYIQAAAKLSHGQPIAFQLQPTDANATMKVLGEGQGRRALWVVWASAVE